jgi:3D (Asp-Asp-Asp) domain-containing protein
MRYKFLILWVGVIFILLWNKYGLIKVLVYEEGRLKVKLRVPYYFKVKDVLNLVNLGKKKNELIIPSLPTRLKNIIDDSERTVCIVKHSISTKEEKKIEYLPYPKIRRYSASLPNFAQVVTKRGEKGIKSIIYKVYYLDGERWYQEKLAGVIQKRPKPEIILLGTQRIYSKPCRLLTPNFLNNIKIDKVLILEATAYSDTCRCCGKWVGKPTSFGLKKRYGVVATDPKIIPMGTKLFVEGYGYAIAGDTGGAIKGFKIDLFFPSEQQALEYGRKRVKVYIYR